MEINSSINKFGPQIENKTWNSNYILDYYITKVALSKINDY